MRTVLVVFLAMALAAPAVFGIERAQGSFERTLSVTGPVQLQVSTGSGSIEIRKGPGNSVRIRGQVQASDRWGDAAARVREVEQNPPIRQTGNLITIGSDVRRYDNVAISYELTVPEQAQGRAQSGSGNVDAYDIHGPLELGTGSGSIRAENIGDRVQAHTGSGNIVVSRAGGAVSTQTGSGSIEVSSVNGSAEAHTGSGNVTVSGATGAVRATAGSGRVRVEKAQSDVEAHSGSGGVTVDGNPRSSRWELESGSGGVNVSIPAGTAFELDAHTGSGNISTSHPVTVSGTLRRNELRGVVIRPDSHIRIRTASGNVRVD